MVITLWVKRGLVLIVPSRHYARAVMVYSRQQHVVARRRWMTGTSQEDWRKQQAGKPVRLLLTCRVGEYEAWLIQRDITVTEKARARVRFLD